MARIERFEELAIRQGSIEDVLAIYPEIPEFHDPHDRAEYEKRLFQASRYLLLVAYNQGKPIGFKVGYERDADGSFYSWMGGVAKQYRRQGIAQQLADTMEAWAKSQGYGKIQFTTRNSHTPMLVFGLSNGFHITGVEPREAMEDYRITLEKKL